MSKSIEELITTHKIHEQYVWTKLSEILPEPILFMAGIGETRNGKISTHFTELDDIQAIANEMVRILRSNPSMGMKLFRHITYNTQGIGMGSPENKYSSRLYIRNFQVHGDNKYPEIRELLTDKIYEERIKNYSTSSFCEIITRLDEKKYTIYAVVADSELRPFRVIAENMCPYPIPIDRDYINEGTIILSVIYR